MRPLVLASLLGLLLAGCKSRHDPPEPPPPPARASLPEWWRSPEDCRRALELAPPRSRTGRARIGTWNIRWFPDGEDGDDREHPGTDVEWLACAIARLEFDVLGVQEIKAYPEAQEEVGRLLVALNRHTRGNWKLSHERCGAPEHGHVGLLWNAARARASDLREESAVLLEKPCDPDHRPAYAARFAFPGGLDLDVAVVHLPAGGAAPEWEFRQAVYGLVGTLVRSDDFVLLGDFNTSGCFERCARQRSSEKEVRELDQALERASLRLLAPSAPCSEHQDTGAFLLDHIAVSRRTRELQAGARASVDGYCLASKCADSHAVGELSVYERISDHCPLFVDFEDRDLD